MPSTIDAARELRVETYARRVLLCFTAAILLALLAHFAIALWARHEVTQVESIVANHSLRLATGQGIYFRLDDYPYVVNVYAPVFYVLQAAVYRLGVPIFSAGRCVSFAALLGIIAVAALLLSLYLTERYAVWAGTLLVASLAVLASWGTVCQVDTLALFFALSAFYNYSRYHLGGGMGYLWIAGFFAILAAFTKQTMIASAAAIALLLLLENRSRAIAFCLGIAAGAAVIALAVNQITHGGFFASAVAGNLLPFSVKKLLDHFQYMTPAGGALAVMMAAAVRFAFRPRPQPLHVYLTTALAVFLFTCPRLGSDLNYQLEPLTVLALCSAWSLDRLGFFAKVFRADSGAVTLLQIPLIFSLVMNLAISGKVLVARAGAELMRRDEYAALRPYFDASRGPVLSVEIDPLVQSHRPLEVEPFIYTPLVRAGRIDPGPVRQDLAHKRFGLVILYEDLTRPAPARRDPELPSLPDDQLDEIRRHYRLVRHIDGPLVDGVYVYAPAPES